MTFEKYNANPENKNIGDCSIRAICTATPLTYQQAKKLLETKVFESGAAWNTVKNITAALADLGIEVKAASRETVNSFTKHCDTGASYVVFVAKHAVAVVNGVIYDTWDSSRRFVKLVAKVSREKFAELKAKYNPEPKKEEKKMDWRKIFAACETIEELKKACERTPAYRGGSFLLQREQHH